MSSHATTDRDMPSREELVRLTSKPMPPWVTRWSAIFAIIGLIAFLIGAFTGQDRMWQAMHFNWLFFASVSQAGVIVVAVQRITTARWSRTIVRMIEGYVAFMPVALLLLVVILHGGKHIFPWFSGEAPIPEKRFWLSPGFFAAREIGMFLILTVLSLWYIYKCVRLDVGVLPNDSGAAWAKGIRDRMRRGFGEERREIHSTHSMQGWLAVVMCLLFNFFYLMHSWDLSMSLDMYFQSTMYGWWFYMGAWLAAIMSWSLLVMWWRRHLAAEDLITEHHFHDLGKLGFAFTAFWGYLTFAQYLVIWYGNMPEETHWFHGRLEPPWEWATLAIVFLAFVIPFFGLLSRAAKVYLPTFFIFALSSVVGIWLLRYIEVYPSLHAGAPHFLFGIWEIGITLGFLGLWGLSYRAFMDAFPRLRVTLMTSPYRDEVQVPVNPDTMEPLPAHE